MPRQMEVQHPDTEPALIEHRPARPVGLKPLEEPAVPPRGTYTLPPGGELPPAEAPDHPLIRRAIIVLVIASLPWIYFYLKFARVVDSRLTRGPFSESVDILSAPETLTPGDTATVQQVVQSLQKSGYTTGAGTSKGRIEQRPGSVEIYPGAGSDSGAAVRVGFANGKITSLTSLTDQRRLQSYSLQPELLANLSNSRERRRLVRYSDIPPTLVQAVLSAEDKRFFTHSGFDLGRVIKAAYVDLKDGRKSEGASTLTMQLARSLWLDQNKSWQRKVKETLITAYLEHKLTKQQLFEDYANEVYLGRRGTFSINGFGEGAQAFFGKNLSQVDLPEAALLAGVIRRPSYYNPFEHPDRAKDRRDLVLALMRRNGYLTAEQYAQAMATPVRIVSASAGEPASSYFLGLLNNEMRNRFGDQEGANRVVYSTIDPDLQADAETAVHNGMVFVDQQLRGRARREGIPPGEPQVALIALDPHTGEIRALVGGRNYADSQLNHVLAMRQPGSVFKPFVYAAALDSAVDGARQIFTPATILHDEPETFSDGTRIYQPRDFHGGFMGDVTLRTALAHSLNVATVSLAQQVGYGRVVELARRAGLNNHIQPTPAVALGAYEATPLEIAGAYTVFANHGMLVHPTTIAMVRSRGGQVLYQHQVDPIPALDPRVAYLMVDMMQEVLRSGTGAAVRSRGFTLPAAGKTGTSRDGWFAGFTDDLLCVVWVGFDDNRDLNLEGAKSALPIWTDFMKRAAGLHHYGAPRAFSRPAGVIAEEICSDTGELAGPYCPKVQTEAFIDGTEPTAQCELHAGINSDSAGTPGDSAHPAAPLNPGGGPR